MNCGCRLPESRPHGRYSSTEPRPMGSSTCQGPDDQRRSSRRGPLVTRVGAANTVRRAQARDRRPPSAARPAHPAGCCRGRCGRGGGLAHRERKRGDAVPERSRGTTTRCRRRRSRHRGPVIARHRPVVYALRGEAARGQARHARHCAHRRRHSAGEGRARPRPARDATGQRREANRRGAAACAGTATCCTANRRRPRRGRAQENNRADRVPPPHRHPDPCPCPCLCPNNPPRLAPRHARWQGHARAVRRHQVASRARHPSHALAQTPSDSPVTGPGRQRNGTGGADGWCRAVTFRCRRRAALALIQSAPRSARPATRWRRRGFEASVTGDKAVTELPS